MNRSSTGSKTATRLLLTASALAFAAPALAHETLFASDLSLGHAAESGERVTQQSGVTQIRLSGGGVASFVAGASFQIRSDGSVDLFAGTVTVAGTEGAAVVVHLADQGEGRVAGRGSAASFSVDAREGGRNEARGHVLTGTVSITFGTGSTRQFTAGQMWHGLGGHVSLAIANGAATVPTGDDSNSTVQPMGPRDGERASLVAAADNGMPVVLGDALAAAGASGDIIAAARRVQAASANPSIETYPAGDLALLVGYAARLNGAYGGVPFNGAASDIIRTYLQFLCTGGAQGSFLSAYAGFMVQYLDLIRAGALPSSFRGASLAQINSFISFRGRTVGFGALSGQNKVLIDAYLAFIQGGGNADQFLVRYTDLTAAYFTYIRGGGTPSAFTGASQTTITAYLIFLRDAGLLANLTAQNQALLTAYLNSLTANGSGLAFADQYRTSLNLYFIYLQQGRLPSGYTAADVAALRQYLETLKATGLFDTVLGSQASFFSGYLIWLQGGGAIDGYNQLPANIFAGYTSALTAYYDYLKQGGTPSGYTTLTQAQISAYLTALQSAGASSRYLGSLTSFWADYFAWISGGNNPNLFAGLPVPPDYPAFTSALNAYYVYLSNGGLPSNYSALTLEQLRTYINALIAAGKLSDLGGNASFLSAYFTYLGNGGSANGYAQLPVYVSYQSALTAYYTYLQGGGLPSAYSALTPAQLQAYLQALINAGVYSSLFSGQTASFLTSYYTFVSGGGSPNGYTGLPAYASYVSALNLYFVYLQGGGIPASYTALTLAQLQAYLQAMIDAGVLGQFFTGQALTFFQGYYSYVLGGGTANSYSGLATIVTGSGSGSGSGAGATGLLKTYNGGFTATTGINLYTNYKNGGGWSSNQTLTVSSDGGFTHTGTATVVDAAGDSRAVIGRYQNGTFGLGSGFTTFGANDGIAYAVMAPIVGTLPASGTINYQLLAATRPVYNDGHTNPGTFSANLTIGFGSLLTFGLDGTITMPDATYTLSTPGRALGQLVAAQVGNNPNFVVLRPTISATGSACTSNTCYLNLVGGFGGSNPQERLGFSYMSFDPAVSSLSNNLIGSALFASPGSYTPPAAAVAAPTGAGMIMRSVGKSFNPGTSVRFAEGSFNTTTSTVNVTTGSDGQLQVGNMSGDVVTRVNANNVDYGTAGGAIGWTRWAGGTATYGTGASNTMEMPANGGIAFIWGAPVTNMPTTGTATYTIAGSTKPMLQSGAAAPGTLNSASLTVNFGTKNADFAANLTVSSATYSISNNTPMPIATDGTFSNFNSVSHIQGFLAGAGAGYAGVTYNIFGPGVSGVIAFTKGP